MDSSQPETEDFQKKKEDDDELLPLPKKITE